MKYKLHDTGNSLLAELLTGRGKPVDSLLVELDTAEDADSPGTADDGVRHAVVAARGSADGAVATFTGLVRGTDFGKHRKGAKITRATALSGGIPVATALIDPPVGVSDTAYISVSVSIKIGE